MRMPASAERDTPIIQLTSDTRSGRTPFSSSSDQNFSFPAVVVSTSKGEVTLDIGGAMRATVGTNPNATSPFFAFNSFSAAAPTGYQRQSLSAAGSKDSKVRLVISIKRRAHAGGQSPLETQGGSYFFMDVPAPGDVVSFEFPSLQKATEDLLKGHTFSLRIRVTAAK